MCYIIIKGNIPYPASAGGALKQDRGNGSPEKSKRIRKVTK